MASYTGICKQCGKKFTTSRSHTEFCPGSGKCRAAYSRALKKESAETHGAFSDTPPSHEQAITVESLTAAIEKLTTEIVNLKALVISGTAARTIEGEKKSDYTATPPTPQKPIDTPLVIREADPEEAKRRSIANTLAALDDF
jgi:hypothetical protein